MKRAFEGFNDMVKSILINVHFVGDFKEMVNKDVRPY